MPENGRWDLIRRLKGYGRDETAAVFTFTRLYHSVHGTTPATTRTHT